MFNSLRMYRQAMGIGDLDFNSSAPKSPSVKKSTTPMSMGGGSVGAKSPKSKSAPEIGEAPIKPKSPKSKKPLKIETVNKPISDEILTGGGNKKESSPSGKKRGRPEGSKNRVKKGRGSRGGTHKAYFAKDYLIKFINEKGPSKNTFYKVRRMIYMTGATGEDANRLTAYYMDLALKSTLWRGDGRKKKGKKKTSSSVRIYRRFYGKRKC